jgi:phosphatidylglycerol:prolipoprotein diacylglycerol transferase
MFPILGQIGPILVPAHSLAWSLSFLVGLLGIAWSVRREGLPVDQVINGMVLVGIGSILGARLSAVLMLSSGEELSWFLRHPVEILKFWKGGLSFYGMVVVTVGAGSWFGFRHDLPITRIADLGIPWVALGVIIMHVGGCFLAGCHPGTPTDLPWGVVCRTPGFHGPRGIPLHPYPLYLGSMAAIGYLGARAWHRARNLRGEGFFLSWFFHPLFRFFRFRYIDGELTLMAGVYYSLFRFFAEFTRGPETQIFYPNWPLSQSQTACVLVFFLCWGAYFAWREMTEAVDRRLPLRSWMKPCLRLEAGLRWLAKRLPYKEK